MKSLNVLRFLLGAVVFSTSIQLFAGEQEQGFDQQIEAYKRTVVVDSELIQKCQVSLEKYDSQSFTCDLTALNPGSTLIQSDFYDQVIRNLKIATTTGSSLVYDCRITGGIGSTKDGRVAMKLTVVVPSGDIDQGRVCVSDAFETRNGKGRSFSVYYKQ